MKLNTMKVYKHKVTGDILNKCKNGNSYYSEKWEGYYIPSEFIENSSDLEEIINTPLFVTDDGVEIFENDSYYLVSNDLVLMYCSSFSIKDLEYKTFAKKENAEEYIYRNKKQFSVVDIEKAFKDYSYFKVKKSTLLKKLCRQ